MSVEKIKLIKRIVGTKDPAIIKKILEYYRTIFKKQIFHDLEEADVQKTEKHIDILNFVESSASSVVRGFGVEPISVPLKNIHILARSVGLQDYAGEG